MPSTYTNGFEFEAEGGASLCVELPAPPRGEVTRFTIKQISGSLDGFDADLLDRKDACASEAEVSSSFEPDRPDASNKLLEPELHRILPQVTVAGAADLSEQYNLNAGYQNRDEQDIRRTPHSRIYLDLAPAGSGTKRFQVAYSIIPTENI